LITSPARLTGYLFREGVSVKMNVARPVLSLVRLRSSYVGAPTFLRPVFAIIEKSSVAIMARGFQDF
jgi:hypothetical protein